MREARRDAKAFETNSKYVDCLAVIKRRISPREGGVENVESTEVLRYVKTT